MVKILNNTFRDVKFGYANEMALICRELGLDAVKLIQAANLEYKRDEIPMPSPGVGGACLTKDPYILIDSCKDINVSADMVQYARSVNELVPRRIVDEIIVEMNTRKKNIESLKIFIIGLGMFFESSAILAPLPPAKITHFILFRPIIRKFWIIKIHS